MSPSAITQNASRTTRATVASGDVERRSGGVAMAGLDANALFGVQPGPPGADVDRERRRAVVPRRDHLALGDVAHVVALLGRALEQQLVVDREDHPAAQPAAAQLVVDADHGEL